MAISWEVEEKKADSDLEHFPNVEPNSPIAVANIDESKNVVTIDDVGNNVNMAAMADVVVCCGHRYRTYDL